MELFSFFCIASVLLSNSFLLLSLQFCARCSREFFISELFCGYDVVKCHKLELTSES